MATLTTANSVFALAIPGLYPVAQILQGYSTDDAFSADDIQPSEVMMGVDGRLSGGFVPQPRPQTIMLQADSPSCQIFDDWQAAQESARELYIASAIISLQGTSQKYSLNRGILFSYSPMPAAKKVLQPRKFIITFESVSLSPI